MPDPLVSLFVFFITLGVIAVAFWPKKGLISRLQRLAHLDERTRLEDALKHLYTCHSADRQTSLESLAGQLETSRAHAATLLSRLTEMGLVSATTQGLTLTEDGLQSALRLVRTHRMWERYLADRTGVPATEWHDEAERMEHTLSPAEVDALDTRLGHPPWDPHGDPIPSATGAVPPIKGAPLIASDPGRTVEIIHLEDEPREIYDALLNAGLSLGQRLEIVNRSMHAVRVRSGGREWDIDSVAAGNITIRELPVGERADTTSTTLHDIAPGETARVLAISRACQGPQRRRLLDLGLIRGTEVRRELPSASGDPIAYRIRGALIALRSTQSSWIAVERNPDTATSSSC